MPFFVLCANVCQPFKVCRFCEATFVLIGRLCLFAYSAKRENTHQALKLLLNVKAFQK
jgi:hypothetical protein